MMEEKKKNNVFVYVIVGVLVLLLGVGAFYLFGNKDNKQNNVDNKGKNASEYISINGKDMLRTDLKLTENAKVESLKKDEKNNIVIVDVIEPDFQFETHYLLCFDKDNKLVFEARDLYDKDNDNNRYKYSGKFEYSEDSKILTFYTKLFLGENDEATGKAFNDKDISELTSTELKTFGNYSDEVKYEYKYENNKFSLVEKTELSKLKDNEYYMVYFK